jgi:SAM-dependent methyltransferase
VTVPPRLHTLVDGLRDPVRYERGRTAYPPELVTLVAQAAALAPGARILDVGAGTGMLARPFAAAGYDVVGVEPLAELRAVLAGELGPARALEGTAEAIPLADGSVAAAVCGDAFHWFDGDAAAAELHRVLAPGGLVLVVFRVPRAGDGPPWLAAVEAEMAAVRPEHPGYVAGRGVDAFARHPGFADPELHELPFERVTDAQGVLDFVASTSFVGVLEPGEREALLERVRAVLPAGELTVPHVAEAWLSRRRP